MNSVKTNNLSFYNDNGIISLSAKQYDTGRKFIFRIVDNGEPFDLTGCDVYLRIFKADKTQFQGEGCCIIEDNNIIVDTSLGNGDQILASDGSNICELHLTGPDGKSLTTWNFVINVEPRVHNGDNIDSIDSWDAWDHVKETTEDFNRKLEEHYFVLTLDKDVAGGVPSLDNNVKVPIAELYEATTSTKGITQLTDSVTSESTTTAATPNSVKLVNDALQEEIKRAKNTESDLDSKKADVESATLTGIPKAPTASAGTNTTQIATTAFVQNAVANLVDSAPETMDTLDELAKALGDDPNFATTVANQIGTKANTSDLTSHTDNKSNPHEVTKAQVGLGNVPNVSTDDQTPTFTETTSLSKLISGEKLSVAFGKISKAVNDLIGHIANKSNPHCVTKSQVGLENVENKSSATIRGELTKDNVISALGYTPSTTDATATVTGVKGEKEEQYRAGNVSLSPADIGALGISSASMKKSPIRDVTHIQNGRLDLDLGWGANHETAAEVSLGIRADESTNSTWTTQLKIGDDDFTFILPDAKGRLVFTEHGLKCYFNGGAYYNFPGKSGILQMSPKNSVIISTPDSVTLHSGETTDISSTGKMFLTSEREIRLIPGAVYHDDSPAADKYVKTGHIKGINDSNGNKASISNFGDIRSETYNGHKVIGTNGGEMEEDATITFRGYSPGDRVDIGAYDLVMYDQFNQILQISTREIIKNGGGEFEISYEGVGIIMNSDSVGPSFGNLIDLGAADRKWNAIYASSGTIQTSDRNKKNAITDIAKDKVEEFIMGLRPVTYKMDDGTSGRTHWGLISQDIEELMTSLGMDSNDFAGFIKSPKIIIRDADENGNPLSEPIKEVVEEEYDYGLRYNEFIAPLVKMVQMQQEEINHLKKEKSELRQRLEKIEKILQLR